MSTPENISGHKAPRSKLVSGMKRMLRRKASERKGSGTSSFSRRSPFRKRRRRAMGIAVLVLAFVCVLLVLPSFSDENKIRQGVEVGGVDVGGMNRAEAREALKSATAQRLENIQFGESGGQSVSGERLGIAVDAAESIEAAYAARQEGWFGKRLFRTLRGSTGKTEISAVISYDHSAAEEALSGIADSVAQSPENATFTVSGGEVEVKEGEPGKELDQQQTLENLEASLASLDAQVPIATESVKPDKTADELAGASNVEKLGEYRTDYRYSNSEARRTNLKRAAQAMNGKVLAPGEVFSFNEYATEVDYETATVFGDGGETSANGGGLCQVASTLYMASQYAGLEIVERHPHYAVLPYIKPGFDATVWFGGSGVAPLDFRFKNTTDSEIYIREYVDDEGIMHGEIWGQPTGKKVEMNTEQVFRDLERGLKWRTYKKVTQDGEVLREGVLYTQIYSFPPSKADEDKYNQVRVGGW